MVATRLDRWPDYGGRSHFPRPAGLPVPYPEVGTPVTLTRGALFHLPSGSTHLDWRSDAELDGFSGSLFAQPKLPTDKAFLGCSLAGTTVPGLHKDRRSKLSD